MREITLVEMLKRGVHFGHRESRWHPKMKPYIYTVRQGIHIIDLEKTAGLLRDALDAVKAKAAAGGTILFVGTKRQAQKIVADAAQSVAMPYVNRRWLGGTMTNFVTISKLIKKLKSHRQARETGELEKYTKKEQLEFTREIAHLEEAIGGIENMEKIPDMLFLDDLKQESTALREAKKMKVPVVALVDTNSDPGSVDYPIPANDDATKSLEFFVSLITEAIEEGKKEALEAKAKAAADA